LTSNVFEQIRTIASDLFRIAPERINAASTPQSIEAWDSIQHLNIVLALEEKFAVELSPEEMEQMTSVGEIAKLVEAKLQAKLQRTPD